MWETKFYNIRTNLLVSQTKTQKKLICFKSFKTTFRQKILMKLN